MKENKKMGSFCVHELQDNRTTKPHQLPIYATSSFEFENIDEGIDIFSGNKKGHVYSRYGNPTMEVVAEKIARLEGFGLDIDPKGLMFSSGMSAISTLMMAMLEKGDKILSQGNLYGGTTELFAKIFSSFGIELVMMDLHDLERVEETIKNDLGIKMLYFETPANPTLACVDIKALADIAKRYGRYSAIDNTFCTPYLQQPFKYGIDFIIHSTTKYLNGHGNSTAGVVIGRNQELIDTKVWRAMKLVGTNCNPWDAWLTNNGIKTLELRMDRHCINAQKVAEYLENHPRVIQVNYPGLPGHPDHEIAKKQMAAFGGMLSFEIEGGLESGVQFMNKIELCVLAPTLGDVDTLILHPASMSHLNIPKEVRLRNGITDGLVRVSIGIENVEDIIGDLEKAL